MLLRVCGTKQGQMTISRDVGRVYVAIKVNTNAGLTLQSLWEKARDNWSTHGRRYCTSPPDASMGSERDLEAWCVSQVIGTDGVWARKAGTAG